MDLTLLKHELTKREDKYPTMVELERILVSNIETRSLENANTIEKHRMDTGQFGIIPGTEFSLGGGNPATPAVKPSKAAAKKLARQMSLAVMDGDWSQVYALAVKGKGKGKGTRKG